MATSNPYYQRMLAPLPNQRVGAVSTGAEFLLIQAGFDKIHAKFPNIAGVVLLTVDELNALAGITGPVQGQLDSLIASIGQTYAKLAGATFTGPVKGLTPAQNAAAEFFATVGFVNEKVVASIAGVASYNGQTGAVVGPTLAGNTFTGAQNEARGADVASAATLNLSGAAGNFVHVTGTVTVTAIALTAGAERTVVFDDALTLTHGANLQLPGLANILTVAGDRAIFRGDAGGVVRCVAYTRADGTALVASATTYDFGALGSATVVQAAVGGASTSMCRLSATRALAVWRNNSSTLLGVVLDISGSTVVAGAPFTIDSAADDLLQVVAVSSTQAVVAYTQSAGITGAATINISGTTAAIGTRIDLSSARNTVNSLVTMDDGRVFFSGNSLKGRILTISGTAISAGAETTLDDNTSNAMARLTSFGGGKLAISYGTSAGVGTLRGITVSSDTITPGGAAIKFGGGFSDVAAVSGSRAFVYSSPSGYAQLASFVGTVLPSEGARVPVAPGTDLRSVRVSATPSGNAALVALMVANSAYSLEAFDLRTGVPQRLSSKPITPPGTAGRQAVEVVVLSATQAILFYYDQANSGYPTARVVNLGAIGTL